MSRMEPVCSPPALEDRRDSGSGDASSSVPEFSDFGGGGGGRIRALSRAGSRRCGRLSRPWVVARARCERYMRNGRRRFYLGQRHLHRNLHDVPRCCHGVHVLQRRLRVWDDAFELAASRRQGLMREGDARRCASCTRDTGGAPPNSSPAIPQHTAPTIR